MAWREELLRLHLLERSQAGTFGLVLKESLCQAAQGHADWMAASGVLSHTGQGGSTLKGRLQEVHYVFGGAGENIAAGQPTPASVMQGWMNSPPHRVNILTPDYREIGLGRAERNGLVYWCVVLAFAFRVQRVLVCPAPLQLPGALYLTRPAERPERPEELEW